MRTPFNPFSIRLIAGIGNPETRYATTYHNAGVQFISFLLKEAKTKGVIPQKRDYGSFSLFTYASGVSLFLSSVSMNLSGRAFQEAFSRKLFKPSLLLVAHDDSDLPLGSYRIPFGSGAAGHHGIQSVIDALGTRDFFRLRLGIRAPFSHRKKQAGDFVLCPMTPSHLRALHEMFSSIVQKYDFIRLLS